MDRQDTIDLIRADYPIHYLNDDEISDPFLAIADFFSHGHLPEMKEMLWLFFKTNITGSFPDGEALLRKERVEMVMLYELLVRLVEAVHLLNEKHKCA
jgi:hypothetical protein